MTAAVPVPSFRTDLATLDQLAAIPEDGWRSRKVPQPRREGALAADRQHQSARAPQR